MKESQSPAELLQQTLLIREEIQERNYFFYTERQEGFTILKVLNCIENQKYLREVIDPYSFYRIKEQNTIQPGKNKII